MAETDRARDDLLGALRAVLPLGTEVTAIDPSPELEAAWDRFMDLVLVDETARRLLFAVKPFEVTYLFQVALDAAAGRDQPDEGKEIDARQKGKQADD